MSANLLRCWRHLRQNLRSAQRAFPNAVLHRIEQAIERSRRGHTAELHIVIESALPLRFVWRGRTPRARALEVFAGIGVWDTEGNNGVLLYLLLADRAVEIVADRAAAARIQERQWGEICSALSDSCRVGNFETGILAAIERIDILLVNAFARPAEKPAALRAARESGRPQSARAAEPPARLREERGRVSEESVRAGQPVASTRVVLLERYGLAEKGGARDPLAQSAERVVGLD